MNTYSFYGPDGTFCRQQFCGPDAQLALNTPAGHTPILGKHDPDRACVVFRHDDFGDALPVVERYKPPAPESDEWTAWAWDADAWAWISTPTTAALARTARAMRTQRIEAIRWRYERHERETRLGVPNTDDMAALDAYAQALADITKQAGFPVAIVWPEEPA